MDNFLPYGRQIMGHWIYEDSQYFHVWSDMLFRARYSKEPKTDIYKGILYTLNYGEFIFGRIGWSKRLNVGEQKLRTFIQKLIDENMIVKVKALSKLTIYKIVNYEKFNQQSNQQKEPQASGFYTNSNQQSNQQVTSIQPADNQQITTKEECNIDNKANKGNKKDLKEKDIVPDGTPASKGRTAFKVKYADFVNMAEEEYGKLVEQYGEVEAKDKIEKLNLYKGSTGKKYASDYLTILNWDRRDNKGKNKIDPEYEKQLKELEEKTRKELGL